MTRRGKTFTHGLTGYASHRCRCDVCKAAKRTYEEHLRKRRKLPPQPVMTSVQHDTLTRGELYRLRGWD